MKIEIHNSGNPANDMLIIYSKEVGPCRPVCTIWEDDLCSHVLTGAQVKKLDAGEITFNVSKQTLLNHSKSIFV